MKTRASAMIEHCLHTDSGVEMRFTGRLYSESTHFDEELGELIRLKLFITDDNHQIFSIVSGNNEQKSRRVYDLRIQDDLCHINNGIQDITLRTEMLLTAVFGLCGIDPTQAETLKASIEETLSAANS